MSQEYAQTAPTAAGTPPVSPEVHDHVNDTGGDGGAGGRDNDSPLESMEDIVAALSRDGQEPDVAESGRRETEAPEEEEAAPAQEGEAEPAVVADVPASWSDAEKAMFSALSPELQQSLSRREAEREQAIARHAQEAAATRQGYDELHTWAKDQLGSALQAASLAAEADFGNVDWLNLQKNDPATYLQLDAMRKERMAALEQGMSQYRELAAKEQQQQRQRYYQHLQAESASVAPVVQKLIGQGFEGKAFAKELSSYLKSVGAPESHIADIGYGYQLVMATKAMLYDRQEKARQSAEQKVAAAPKVQKTAARQGDSGKDAELRNARAALARNPNSKDALIRVLMAEG